MWYSISSIVFNIVDYIWFPYSDTGGWRVFVKVLQVRAYNTKLIIKGINILTKFAWLHK